MYQNYNSSVHSSLSSGSRRLCSSFRYREKDTNTPLCQQILGFNLPLTKISLKNDDKDKHSDSFDTCESENTVSGEREIVKKRSIKIKVELCKNFVEKGYCPYENRCKFAHGIEELRSRDTYGSSELYRTRKCKVFYEKNQCKFGERCNFVHDNRRIGQILQSGSGLRRKAIRMNFQEIDLVREGGRSQSRLMQILELDRKE